MKKHFKLFVGLAILLSASFSYANPKCSHRLASNTNDLLKNTNPVRQRVAKTNETRTPIKGKQSTRTGVQ